jgi:phosphate transport system ATP-binding protein
MDEFCSVLKPISTLEIEDLLQELKEKYTIMIVTHNMQQISRVADNTAFFNLVSLESHNMQQISQVSDTKRPVLSVLEQLTDKLLLKEHS